MSVKSTIKYGSTTIVDQFVESSDSVVVSYNNSTVATLVAGDDKKLNTKDKICQDYITIGSKILNVKDKLLTDYVECIVATNGPSGATLNDCTWSEINEFAASGSSYWSVGDTKTGTYINGENHPYRIVEFNHSGDAGNITFEQTDLTNNTYKLYTTISSTAQSWGNSDLKTTINNFSITSDLSVVIKTTSKPCATSVSDGTEISVLSNLWIMSEKEIAGTTSYSICKTEGTEYTYYVNAGSTQDSRIKTQSGSTTNYWLRSALQYAAKKQYFAYINSDGTVKMALSSDAYGVSICFCI